MLKVSIRNQTQQWIPSFILTTMVTDIDGIPIVLDTTYVAYAPTKQSAESIRVYLDSLFTPLNTGSVDIHTHGYTGI